MQREAWSRSAPSSRCGCSSLQSWIRSSGGRPGAERRATSRNPVGLPIRSRPRERGPGRSPRRRPSRPPRRSRPGATHPRLRLEHAAVVVGDDADETPDHVLPAPEEVRRADAPGERRWRASSSRTSAASARRPRASASLVRAVPPAAALSARGVQPHHLRVAAATRTSRRRRRPRPCRRTCPPRSCARSRPSTSTRPPVMYSQPWSPTPSTTAVAPELRTREALAGDAADERLAAGRAVQRDVAGDDVLVGDEGGLGAGKTTRRPPDRPLPR